MLFNQPLFIFTNLAGILSTGFGQICSEEGFFRNPDDCTQFYRCIDIWQNGRKFNIFKFHCPVGTTFDESYMVCNWAYQAPPCLEASSFETETFVDDSPDIETTEPNVDKGDQIPQGLVDDAVIITPTFNYKCNSEGLFEHSDDCEKFWVCEVYDVGEIGGQLYICPDNYWVCYRQLLSNHFDITIKQFFTVRQ